MCIRDRPTGRHRPEGKGAIRFETVSYTHLDVYKRQGALWGPVVFLWITFGTIFAGGVHDYFSGMMSERNDGASIAEVTGRYLGPVMQLSLIHI